MNLIAKHTIMVVDDTEHNIDILLAFLNKKYDVRVAVDGVTALQDIFNYPPDLILLDIIMPGMNGFEVLKRLKQKEETRRIPVAVVTDLNDRASRIKAIECGADEFLSKPINDLELLVRVKSLVEKKHIQDREQSYLRALETEKEKSEALLRNMLPEKMAGRLKEKQSLIAESHPDVMVFLRILSDLPNCRAA